MSMRSMMTKDKQRAKIEAKNKQIEKQQSASGSLSLKFKRTNEKTSLHEMSLTQNKSKKQQSQSQKYLYFEDRQEKILSCQSSSASKIMDDPSGLRVEEPPADKFKRQLERQRSQLAALKVATVDFIRNSGVFSNSKTLEIQIQNWKQKHESARQQSNQFLQQQSTQLLLIKDKLKMSQNKVRQLEERVKKQDNVYRATISEKNQYIRNLQTRIKNLQEHYIINYENQAVLAINLQFSTLKFEIHSKYKRSIQSIQLKHAEQIRKLSQQWKQQVNKIQNQYKVMKQQTDQVYSQQIKRADNTAQYYRQLSSLNLQKLDKVNEAASIIVKMFRDTVNALNSRLNSQEKHQKNLKHNVTVYFSKFLQMTKQTIALEQNYYTLAEQINFFRNQNWFQILQNTYLVDIISKLQTQICQKIQKQAALQKQYDEKIQQMHQEIIFNMNKYQQQLDAQLTKTHQSYQKQRTIMLVDHKCEVDTLTNQIQTLKGLLQMQDKMFDMAEQCSQKTIGCLQVQLQTVTQKYKRQTKDYRQKIEWLQLQGLIMNRVMDSHNKQMQSNDISQNFQHLRQTIHSLQSQMNREREEKQEKQRQIITMEYWLFEADKLIQTLHQSKYSQKMKQFHNYVTSIDEFNEIHEEIKVDSHTSSSVLLDQEERMFRKKKRLKLAETIQKYAEIVKDLTPPLSDHILFDTSTHK